jgi:hypothetical protein
MMNKAYIIIANSEWGEERIMSVYNDRKIAEKTCAELQEKGYGDWDEFRIEDWTFNEELFRANLEEVVEEV